MKITPALLGVIAAQSGDYEDYDAERGKNKGNKNYVAPAYNPVYEPAYQEPTYQLNYDNSYDTSYGRALTDATAVTCWESNNMGTHDTNPDGHSHEGTTTTRVASPANGRLTNRDPYGWSNFHYNHKANGDADADHEVNSDDAHGGNVHSLYGYDHRLSGCIYEFATYLYSSSTYKLAMPVTYTVGSTKLHPVWWHYFNAHVLPGGNKQTHNVVMANPTYEGLGYLNFIVTFITDNAATAANYIGSTNKFLNRQEIESTPSGFDHTDAVAAGSAFKIDLVTTATWLSTYGTSDWSAAKVALSSFPHNDLGKDFRFNIRILHQMGEGDKNEVVDSYYFYRVNTVTIVFPHRVGCHWIKNGDSNNDYRCMDSASTRGHHQWHNGANTVWAANTDATAYIYDETFSVASNGLDVCSATYVVDKLSCGTTYKVDGLMNSYDEYAQQEFGTHQEFWFQFEYVMTATDDSIFANCDTDLHDMGIACNQAPNMLFNSFEVTSVTPACGTTNLFNGNLCAAVSGTTRTKSNEIWN